MSNGIHVVFQANKRGGLRQSTGDVHILNLALTALLDCSSSNPFQQLGISEGVVFENPDNDLFMEIKESIKDIFERFENSKLAKLQDRADNLSMFRTNEGEYGLKIFFVNLETNSPGSGAIGFGVGGARVL